MQGWEWITAARVVTSKPCRLLGLTITPSAATAIIIVRDGDTVIAPIILQADLVVKETMQLNFPGGIKTDRGLFVGDFTDITGVLVQWEVD